ncbi:ProQ/FINO family protein [Sulfitobacter sp. 1A13353]|uniref:ProQ/FINO family protein n=1 Tax=Sulfitobacter sp. 1A13353 TaxID=3368568 RepID=UPI0037462CF7
MKNPPMTSRTKRDIRDKMQASFPAFFGSMNYPLPAAEGMQESFGEATASMISKQQAEVFLAYWCKRPEYLAALTNRARRFDLQGEPCGLISAQEREDAVEELAMLLATRWLSKKHRVRKLASKRMRRLNLPDDVCRRIETIVANTAGVKEDRRLPIFGSDLRD